MLSNIDGTSIVFTASDDDVDVISPDVNEIGATCMTSMSITPGAYIVKLL